MRDPRAPVPLGEDSDITDESGQPVLLYYGTMAILAQFGLVPQGAT